MVFKVGGLSKTEIIAKNEYQVLREIDKINYDKIEGL